MRILFALPGFHRLDRGAEIALISVASELANRGDEVTVIGSGQQRPDMPYRFIHAASIRREKFEAMPSLPGLRNECAYEELTFVPGLLRHFRPGDYDVTLTCGYPYANWTLRRPTLRGPRPAHVFVTQNGDWPAFAQNSEYRFFGCEGLVCTNPEFFQRNQDRWRCALIPNGADTSRFCLGSKQREQFGLPPDSLVVLMVSALIPSKRVGLGIEAVSQIPGAHLVVAGDGPLRQEIDEAASRLLPGRFSRITLSPEQMPALYQSADVFLHLSKQEAFGNVYVEAMACGLPVVAHDSARLRWIVGDDEFLLEAENPADIARNIELAGKISPSRQNSSAKKAAAYAWTNIATSYREFLQDVIASSSGPNKNT